MRLCTAPKSSVLNLHEKGEALPITRVDSAARAGMHIGSTEYPTVSCRSRARRCVHFGLLCMREAPCYRSRHLLGCWLPYTTSRVSTRPPGERLRPPCGRLLRLTSVAADVRRFFFYYHQHVIHPGRHFTEIFRLQRKGHFDH